MNNDLISIIIPVYNTGKSAKKLAEFLLEDKYKNTEIILVDDGSKDDSLETLKEIDNKRVKIFSKKNGGAASARNLGIQKAMGKYLIFIDSDDGVSPDFISELYKGIKMSRKTKLAITSTRYCRLKTSETRDVYLKDIKRGKRESLKNYILRMLILDGRIYSSTNKIYIADVVKKNNIQFDEGRDFAEDTHFVLKYLKAVEDCEIKLILKPLYIYNFGTKTSTIKKSATKWENWNQSYDDVLEWVGNKPTTKQKVLLSLIRLRWRISYCRSVRRSK